MGSTRSSPAFLSLRFLNTEMMTSRLPSTSTTVVKISTQAKMEMTQAGRAVPSRARLRSSCPSRGSVQFNSDNVSGITGPRLSPSLLCPAGALGTKHGAHRAAPQSPTRAQAERVRYLKAVICCCGHVRILKFPKWSALFTKVHSCPATSCWRHTSRVCFIKYFSRQKSPSLAVSGRWTFVNLVFPRFPQKDSFPLKCQTLNLFPPPQYSWLDMLNYGQFYWWVMSDSRARQAYDATGTARAARSPRWDPHLGVEKSAHRRSKKGEIEMNKQAWRPFSPHLQRLLFFIPTTVRADMRSPRFARAVFPPRDLPEECACDVSGELRDAGAQRGVQSARWDSCEAFLTGEQEDIFKRSKIQPDILLSDAFWKHILIFICLFLGHTMIILKKKKNQAVSGAGLWRGSIFPLLPRAHNKFIEIFGTTLQ